MIRAVTVYCSASRHVDAVYFRAAADLGRAIGAAGWRLVYGGNNLGLMDAVASGTRAAGGKATGITPRLMVEEGCADRLADELVVTETLRQRKALLESRGDAFITLPGGLGTLEEFFEILVGKFLRYHDKPIVLLNVNGFYDPLLAMLEHGVDEQFIKRSALTAMRVANSVEEAMAYLHLHAGPAHEPAVAEPSLME